MKIKSVAALEILDSRGNPTVATTVILDDGSTGWAAVPSGASTGKYEAVELRDGDPKRYNGLGVLNAVNNVNTTIADAVIGLDAEDQKKLDETMISADGTENKGKLGANAILSVSLATAKAQAVSEKKPLYEYLTKFNPDFNGKYVLPIPIVNILNGGKHADWATDIQEYMILSVGAKNFSDATRMCSEIYFHLKNSLKTKGYSILIGDEGGFAPNVKTNEEPFRLIAEAIESSGYVLRKDIYLGIDAAASEFYLPSKEGSNGQYQLKKENKSLTTAEFSAWLLDLKSCYPIASMEDVFAEDDWLGFKEFLAKAGNGLQVVGDDLYVTNIKRLQQGINEKATNSILIKLNQIGTLTETVNSIILARKNNMTAVVSHRSGETEDTFIADFVVAMGTGQIKAGAPARGERTAKYNRLLAIEKELGEKAVYASWPF